MALILFTPRQEMLSFRQELLADPETMAYNEKWGGTLAFPPEKWSDWYNEWVLNLSGTHFYRYVYDDTLHAPVGEVACHWGEFPDPVIDALIKAEFRGRGYGRQALRLLLSALYRSGIRRVCDNIAPDNPSVSLFLQEGFVEISRTEEYILVAKDLEEIDPEEIQ